MFYIYKKVKEKLYISSEYKQEFIYTNREHNNWAAILIAFTYMLLTGFAMTVGFISLGNGAENVGELKVILPLYIIGFILSAFISIALISLRKKGLSRHIISESLVTVQVLMVVVLMEISAHIEIPEIGIKNINAIILVMFCIVFFLRFRLLITFFIELGTVMATVILLIFEKDAVTNFYPSLVNIIAAGIVACVSAYLYWKSRYESFISANELEKLVMSDALTKISNRRGFDDYFNFSWSRALEEKSQLTLFIIDIDHFKFYNDTYGHIKGDECLSAVADILADSIRRDDFVARYGGEEFAVILRSANTKASRAIADRIFVNVKEANIQNVNSPVSDRLTVSLGCMSCFPAASGITQQKFLEMADEALYMAKNQGRNRLVFHPEVMAELEYKKNQKIF